MDRIEEGLEKLQETKEKFKGEVKDRIKDVKGGDIKYSLGYYHEDISLI